MSISNRMPQNKPTAGDADVVSTVRGDVTASGFDGVKGWLRGAPEREVVGRT